MSCEYKERGDKVKTKDRQFELAYEEYIIQLVNWFTLQKIFCMLLCLVINGS